MAVDPTPIPAPGQRMQRVRVGVTGLAAVILVVALATAIATGVRRNVSAENSSATAIMDNAAGADNGAAHSEPLAQLGVAPASEALKSPATATK